MLIIGLAGKSQSGKDSICSIIFNENVSCMRFAFANLLKEFIRNAANKSIPESEKDKPLACFDGRSLGEMCQVIGQAIRNVEPNFFVNKLYHTVYAELLPFETVQSGANYGNAFFPFPDIMVVTDVRYINEAQMIKTLGGKLIRIHRNIVSIRPSNHPSETEMDSLEFRSLVDFDLYNHGDLAQLENSTKNLLKSVIKEG